MDAEAEARKLTHDRDMIHEIAALVERAVAAEREACAKIADTYGHENWDAQVAATIIGSKIRARTPKE